MNNDQIYMGVMTLLMGGGIVIWSYVFFGQYKIWKQKRGAMLELNAYLMAYRAKVTESSRVLFNPELLREAFPEYEEEVQMWMWEQCQIRKWVQLDGRDGAWILTP